MNSSSYKLQYGDGAFADRKQALEAFKAAMVEAIVTGPEAAVEASGVADVDTPLIQLMAAIAHATQKLSIPFSVLNPPLDLVLGFDKLGIDWRGLGITFRES
jgi:hypothetical protein